MSSICGLPTASRLPGCVELRGLVGSPEESQIHIRAEYDFHARVHMMVGGAWDCPISLLTATQSPAMSDANSVRIIETIALGLNTLWRTLQISGHLICGQDCNLTDDDGGATTTTSPSCACSCPIVDEIYNSGNLTASFAYDLMDSTGLWSMIDTLCDWCLDYNETSGKYEFSGTMTGSTQEEELTILFTLLTCHPGHVSQMGTPLAGPNDPLFWPIHGAFERVIDYLRLTGNTTHDCAVVDSCTSSAENRKIRWDYDDDPLCVPMLVNGTQQIGQGWHDILPFSGFLGDESSHDYSNEELWQLFDPLNPRLTYIYDSFDWEHCHEEEE
uniref:Tyrosinase copper-binding domain-containing protein n=1 Tax=Octactis speculum TaxID=3111310 RepID=A0A7S2FFR2_9STRA